MKRSALSGWVGLFVLSIALPSFADDWPQWRGPQRNGVSRETRLLKNWPNEGPKLSWKITNTGSGYAAPSVLGDRLYMLGNDGLENEFVAAFAVADGKRTWTAKLGKVGNPKQNPSFPAARSTPTVESEALYVLSSDGDAAAVERSTGKVRWQKNLRTEFGGQPGEWAYSESPLIDGDTFFCTPGGSDATLLALNKKTGAVIWKSVLPEHDLAAFASGIIVEFNGVKQYVQLLQKGLVGVDAKTGQLLWRYAKPISRYGANIPTPLAADGHIYAASAGTGGGLAKLVSRDGKIGVEEVYFESKLPTAIGGSVKVGDHLYGTTAQAMLCLGFKTGQVKWEERAIGAAAICYADDRLYLHGENGTVALMEPSAEGYREHGRFNPPDRPRRGSGMEKSWAYPVVANGALYIRDHGTLWNYDVKAR
jgi:outer membrane protein assembly factor BamB